jgi:deoxyribonuclease V
VDVSVASDPGLFVAVDVHYLSALSSRAALVAARDSALADIVAERSVLVAGGAPYRPGQFYLRELPPLRAVLRGDSIAGRIALIVIDAYVDLDAGGQPGLGAHVHQEFGVPVIGVAKSAYPTATHAAPVLRGESRRPLLVTSAGLSHAEAARLVGQMAGRFRLPDALRRADALARGAEPLHPPLRTGEGLEAVPTVERPLRRG